MPNLFCKTGRYLIACVCVGSILLWTAKEPPILNLQQMKVTEGLYQCVLHTGGKYGPNGPHIVDGVLYYGHFSYLFGINAPLPCFRELNGHQVRISYLLPSNSDRRLTLEVFDFQSGRIYGITKEENLFYYQEEVQSKFTFYLSKLGLLLLALRLTCWNLLKVVFKKLINGIKNYAVDR